MKKSPVVEKLDRIILTLTERRVTLTYREQQEWEDINAGILSIREAARVLEGSSFDESKSLRIKEL